MRFSSFCSTAVYLCSASVNLCSISMEDSIGVNLGLEFEPKFTLGLRPDFEQKFTLGFGLEFEQKVTLGLGLEIVRTFILWWFSPRDGGFQALSPNLFVPWIKSIQQWEAQKLAMLLLWWIDWSYTLLSLLYERSPLSLENPNWISFFPGRLFPHHAHISLPKIFQPLLSLLPLIYPALSGLAIMKGPFP